MMFSLMALTIPSVDSLGAVGIKQRIPSKTSLPLAVNAGISKINPDFLDGNHIHIKARDHMNKIFMFRIFGVNRKSTNLTRDAAKR